MTTLALPAGAAGIGKFGAAALAALAALAVMPWFASPFILHLAILTCLNTVIVSGLALVSRCGQLSLGHAAFVAIGAYVSVLAGQHWQLSFLPATVLARWRPGPWRWRWDGSSCGCVACISCWSPSLSASCCGWRCWTARR